MNPYMNYNQYMSPYVAPQPIQHIPQPAEQKVVTYTVDSAEQLSSITPMPNIIYLGVSRDGNKIFQRRMNNDGLMEVKTYTLVGEQTKKSDVQEILERVINIENKLAIGVPDGTNGANVA